MTPGHLKADSGRVSLAPKHTSHTSERVGGVHMDSGYGFQSKIVHEDPAFGG